MFQVHEFQYPNSTCKVRVSQNSLFRKSSGKFVKIHFWVQPQEFKHCSMGTWDRAQESVHTTSVPDYSDSCCSVAKNCLEMQCHETRRRKQSQKIQVRYKLQVEVFANDKYLDLSNAVMKENHAINMRQQSGFIYSI